MAERICGDERLRSDDGLTSALMKGGGPRVGSAAAMSMLAGRRSPTRGSPPVMSGAGGWCCAVHRSTARAVEYIARCWRAVRRSDAGAVVSGVCS